MRKLRFLLIILFLPIFSVYGATEKEIKKVKDLDKACIDEKTKKLEKVQQKYITACIKKEKKDPEYCKRYYKDYGWGKTSGRFRTVRLFDDLPVCIEAFEARKALKR